MIVDSNAADICSGVAEGKTEFLLNRIQHLDSLGHHFRTDTVTGQNCNLVCHSLPRMQTENIRC